jgi:hypothetical protein
VNQFQYMQVAHPYGILQAHDLNAYGQQGWQLVAAQPETSAMGTPTGLTVYTFMRQLPELIHELPRPPWAARPEEAGFDPRQPHEHEARASRKDPVVSSAPLADTDSEE